jgi:hypothetical protein
MIDFIILEQMTAFAVIMQKHPGWVGKWEMASYLFQIFDPINSYILSYMSVNKYQRIPELCVTDNIPQVQFWRKK